MLRFCDFCHHHENFLRYLQHQVMGEDLVDMTILFKEGLYMNDVERRRRHLCTHPN